MPRAKNLILGGARRRFASFLKKNHDYGINNLEQEDGHDFLLEDQSSPPAYLLLES